MPSTTGSPARVPEGLDDAGIGQPDEQRPEDLAAEQPGQPVALCDLLHAPDNGLPCGRDGEINRQSTQDEQESQGDDKRRQPSTDDQDPVDRTDGDRQQEGDQDRGPYRPADVDRQERDHDPDETDHRSHREVELVRNHQQARANRYDDELSRYRRPVEDAFQRKHAGATGNNCEIDEDEDDADNRSEFGPVHGPPETRNRLDPLVDGSVGARSRAVRVSHCAPLSHKERLRGGG